ncbi:MAG: GTPase HflX [Lachnospiraceae bacterium]|nr:GTPase HflX [Lachnospiraceae bacterium]
MKQISETTNRALLIGVNLNNGEDFDHSMEELSALAKACHYEPVGIIVQNLPAVHTALYIGTGKVTEVKETAALLEAGLLIFDNDLTPTQLRNLQEELELPIFDRTYLILEIFKERARTKEAKLQVELASLQYMLPRLVGMRASLSRQGGTSGSQSSKGAGEKKLELDRRHIEHRISELKKDLEQISKERSTQRKKRDTSDIPQVALVGYTNAGKSTLLNAFIDRFLQDEDKKVLEKDMLFATLDTTVRKITTETKQSFLLTDTVGFIDKLPHNLVKAFRSTLEEVKYADLLLEIIDFSDENHKEHMRVTNNTLQELGAGNIPVLYIFNKSDRVMDTALLPKITENKIYISAKTGTGLDELTKEICRLLFSSYIDCTMCIPYEAGSISSYLLETAYVKKTDYRPEGIFLELNLKESDYKKFIEYCC